VLHAVLDDAEPGGELGQLEQLYTPTCTELPSLLMHRLRKEVW
jgi:hypothetical protein